MNDFTRNLLIALTCLSLVVVLFVLWLRPEWPTREGIRRFIKSVRNYHGAEYALIIGLIVVVAMVALQFQDQMDGALQFIAEKFGIR